MCIRGRRRSSECVCGDKAGIVIKINENRKVYGPTHASLEFIAAIREVGI